MKLSKFQIALIGCSILLLMPLILDRFKAVKEIKEREKMENKNLSISIQIGNSGKLAFDKHAEVQARESLLNAVLGKLLYISPNHEILPGLVKSFSWNEKDQSYTLRLRDGLRFHNGRNVTANDLKYSLERGLSIAKGSWTKAFLSNIDKIEVSGNLEVTVKLKTPNPSFLHSLTLSSFSLVPKEEIGNKKWDDWNKWPIGAGKFKIKNIESSTNIIELERASKSDVNAPTTVYLTTKPSGKKPHIAFAASKNFDGLNSKVFNRVTSLTGIYFNYLNDLASNKKFREAVRLAINTEPLSESSSIYEPATEFLASHFWGRSNLKSKSDINRAREMFKEIGVHGKKIKVPVFNSDFSHPIHGKYLKVLKKQLSESGLEVEFFESSKKFLSKEDEAYPFKIMSLSAAVSDPLILFSLLREGSPWEYEHPKSDPAFESLYKAALSSKEFSEKVRSVESLSRHLAENNIMIPLLEKHPYVEFDSNVIADFGSQFTDISFNIENIRMVH